jgi:hypothetical protein
MHRSYDERAASGRSAIDTAPPAQSVISTGGEAEAAEGADEGTAPQLPRKAATKKRSEEYAAPEKGASEYAATQYAA